MERIFLPNRQFVYNILFDLFYLNISVFYFTCFPHTSVYHFTCFTCFYLCFYLFQHNNPYIMAMVNDGTQQYDHQRCVT